MNATKEGTGHNDETKDFDDLAPKQRKIVDARARNPEWTNQRIVEELDTNKGYVSRVLNDFEDIVEQRRGEYMDEQSGLQPKDGGEVNSIVQDGAQAGAMAVEDGITVHFPPEMVREALRRRELPEEVYEHFVDVVMERAFGPSQQDPDDQ